MRVSSRDVKTREPVHHVIIVALCRDMASVGDAVPGSGVGGGQARCWLLWGRCRCPVAATRNCCGGTGRGGASVCGSYESVRPGDTGNNCSVFAEGVGEEPRSSEVLPFHRQRWGRRSMRSTSRTSPRAAVHAHPPPQHRPDCRRYRNHGCPFRGSFAICDHDRRTRHVPIGRVEVLIGASSSLSALCPSESSGRCRTAARGRVEASMHGIGSVAGVEAVQGLC